jgi:hypothetical protein
MIASDKTTDQCSVARISNAEKNQVTEIYKMWQNNSAIWLPFAELGFQAEET